jgi:hypothetical protein
VLSKDNLWMFFLKNWCHLSNKDVQCQTLSISFVQHVSFICLIWNFFSSTNYICLTLLMSFCQHFLCVVALVNIQCMTLDLHVLSQNKFCMFKLCFNFLLQYVAKLLLVIFYSYIQLCYQEEIWDWPNTYSSYV